MARGLLHCISSVEWLETWVWLEQRLKPATGAAICKACI